MCNSLMILGLPELAAFETFESS